MNGGEDSTGSNVARFARMAPRLLQGSDRPLARADLRYTNGFALAWADRTEDKT